MHVYNPADPIRYAAVRRYTSGGVPVQSSTPGAAGISVVLPPAMRVMLRQVLTPFPSSEPPYLPLPILPTAWLVEVLLQRQLYAASADNLDDARRTEYYAVARNGIPLESAEPSVRLSYGIEQQANITRTTWAIVIDDPVTTFRLVYRPAASLRVISAVESTNDSFASAIRPTRYAPQYYVEEASGYLYDYASDAEVIAASVLVEPIWP
jgi:hypothetical protein